VYAVVSGQSGDGKTVVAANSALAAARTGSRVLAIDADFGNQQLTTLLSSGEAEIPFAYQKVNGLTDLARRRNQSSCLTSSRDCPLVKTPSSICSPRGVVTYWRVTSSHRVR
jgi:septum formation inhibitor-activating ATPase MinD